MEQEESQNNEIQESLRQILTNIIAKSQIDIGIEIILSLKRAGCYSRSGKQMFASEVRATGPRATVYRVVSTLERHGLIDRESKYSGYFLSHNFSNLLEEKSEKWRKFARGP